MKKRKKKPRKQRESPTLPNALMIHAKEGKSYADILRKIKLDASSKQIGENVDKVRRTNTGQLLIVLDKKSADKAELLRKLMADALKEDADVVSRVQQVDLEIRDLDETTTKEEIANALKKAAGDDSAISVEAVKSLRKAYGETQIASVRLSAETARRIIGEGGKIRIGWVRSHQRGEKAYQVLQVLALWTSLLKVQE